MNEEAQLLVTLWESIQEYIPTNEKQSMAEKVIQTLINYGNDFKLLHDAEGNCTFLDRALAAVGVEEEEETDYFFDEYEDTDI